jgi:hypothetical protein
LGRNHEGPDDIPARKGVTHYKNGDCIVFSFEDGTDVPRDACRKI